MPPGAHYKDMPFEFLAIATTAAVVASGFGSMLWRYDVYEWRSEEQERDDPYGLYRQQR